MLDALATADRRMSARISTGAVNRLGMRMLVWVHHLSQTGAYGIGWILLFAIVVSVHSGWRIAGVAAACIVGTLLLNTAIKLVVRRPRPVGMLGDAPATFSFPSAHTSMAVVGAAIMTVLIPVLVPLWWGWALALGLSRIMLGVHYVGDVVAGVVLGALLAWFVALPLVAATPG